MLSPTCQSTGLEGTSVFAPGCTTPLMQELSLGLASQLFKRTQLVPVVAGLTFRGALTVVS